MKNVERFHSPEERAVRATEHPGTGTKKALVEATRAIRPTNTARNMIAEKSATCCAEEGARVNGEVLYH